MTLRSFTFLSATCIVSFLSFSFIAGWELFVSEEANFAILAPGQMVEKSVVVETEMGSLEYKTFYFNDDKLETANMYYQVLFCQYPEGSFSQDSTDLIEEFFEATIDETIQTLNGNLLYADEIKYFESPGRVWKTGFGDGKLLSKNKAYLVGDCFYSLQVICNEKYALNVSMDKFLDSFRLME
jgi:hypothetical protein